MSIIGTIHEDVTTDILGKIGKWQCLITFVSTLFMVTNVFNYHEDIPLIKPTDGPVCMPEEEYVGYNTTMCFLYNGNEKHRCTKWHTRLLGLIWLNRSWEFFCDDQLKLLSIAMICRMGSAFGCVIFGLVADSFGRKRAMMISVVMELPMKFLLTLCDSEGWFRLLVFLRSLFGGANVFMGLLMICEVASNTWRTRLMGMTVLPRIVTSLCTVPLANCLTNIDNFSFVAFLYSLGLLFASRWLTESPHWLLHNRNILFAEKILYNAAAQNGVQLCEDFKIRPVNHREALKMTTFTLAISCGTIGRFTIGIITPRLFAINIRATALGSCFALGQFGSMISYLTFLLEALDHFSLSGLMVAATLTLCALCLVLPDVDYRELPDIMEDMDYFLDLTKPLRWATQKTHSPSFEEVEIRVYSFSTDRDLWVPGFPEQRQPPHPHSWRRLWQRALNFFRLKGSR